MTITRHRVEPESGVAFEVELDESLPNEKRMLHWLSAGEFYEPDVTRIFTTVLREGDTVVDVGANLGYFTLLAASLVGPAGRVVSFEPDPANVARLKRQLEINGLRNVTVVEQAASDRAGEVEFFINSDDSGGNALWDPGRYPGNVRSQASPQRRRVPATTLQAEAKRLRLATPKLVKVDTEGAEQNVVAGARALLEGCATPFVVCELHEFGLEQMGASQESLRGLMEELGYSTFALSWRPVLPRLIPPATRIHSRYIVNLLFSTPDLVGSYWPTESIDPRDL